LIRIPTDNLNSAVGEVAFAALSRLQHDSGRLRRYFLKGYSLVVALTLPATIACAVFADDLITVLLGAKWIDAAPIFRLLAPTILVFAVTNPLGWLLSALGLVGRALKISLVFAPFMIAGYVIGLPYGPRGVALAYSGVMVLWAVPFVVSAVHGTVISVRDILTALRLPAAASIVAAGLASGVRIMYGPALSPLPRLVLELSVLFVAYAVVLLAGAGPKSVFIDMLRAFIKPSAAEEKSLASV
jgi:O-antigen/teichoic acid export membrane protein